jgi:hypothetical protein
MIKIQTQQIIDVQDWDELVEKTYGRPYSFQQQDDCKQRGTEYITVPGYQEDYENDTIPEVINGEVMGVSFAAWLARDPKAWNGQGKMSYTLELFWHRNFYPHVSMVANDLHAKGLIPAGEYGIKIDW